VAQTCLAGAEIRAIEGVLNGTSNFILTRMRGGMDYAAALAEAQRMGIAEADPTLDVEGHDTANKLALIANACMGADLKPARPTPAQTPVAQTTASTEKRWAARPIELVGYGVSGILPLGRVLAGGASRQFPRPGLTRRGLFLAPLGQRTGSQHRAPERSARDLA